MRTLVLVAILLATGAVHGATTGKGNDYTLQVGNINWAGGTGYYNCFSGTAYPYSFNFTITKAENGRRYYAVCAGPSQNTCTYSRQMSSGANTLTYQIYTTSDMTYVVKAPPAAASASETISGFTISNGAQVVPISVIVFIPPNQVVPPGTYTDQVTISIYGTYDDTHTPDDFRTVTVTAVVAASTDLSLVTSGAAYSSSNARTLDFGVMSPNQNLGCDLLVLKNTACTVTFTSIHQGVLRMPSGGDQVPYSFSANGSHLDLSSPAQTSLPSGVMGIPGVRMPLNVTLGTFSPGIEAGIYQDQVIISVSAQ